MAISQALQLAAPSAWGQLHQQRTKVVLKLVASSAAWGPLGSISGVSFVHRMFRKKENIINILIFSFFFFFFKKVFLNVFSLKISSVFHNA